MVSHERLDQPAEGWLEPFLGDIEVSGRVRVGTDHASAWREVAREYGLLGHVAVERLIRGALEPVSTHGYLAVMERLCIEALTPAASVKALRAMLREG